MLTAAKYTSGARQVNGVRTNPSSSCHTRLLPPENNNLLR
jgi:hypothetical protein